MPSPAPAQSSVPLAKQPPLWLLIGITSMAPIAMNGVLSANTAVMDDLSTTYSYAQMVLSLYLLASMISQVILGMLADRIGRRPVMIAGLAMFATGSLLCALAPGIGWLLFGRFVQGFGAAVCIFLTRTIMRDVHPKDKAASAIGYMVTAMMIAPLFGPALFGWLTDVGSWRYMYVLLTVSGIALTLLSYRFQNETLSQSNKPKQGLISAAKELLLEPEYIAYAVIMCGGIGIYYCFLAGAPFVVMELRQHTATNFGLWFSMVAIGYLTGNFIAGRFSEKLGTYKMIRLSMVPLAAGVILFWVFSQSESLIGLFFPMLLIALSNGMCLPNLMSSAMSVKLEMAGSASGLLGTIQIASAIVVTLILSATLTTTDTPLFAAITLCGMTAFAGLYLLQKSIPTN